MQGRPRILVIDDDETVADLITDILDSLGFDLTAIYRPREGLERLRQDHHYDLLILDLGMPEIDGVEVVARIRQDLGLGNLPILILSAYPQLRQRVPREQVSGFLSKPFTVDELVDTVERILKERNREVNSVTST